ncbi:Ail/Lom family outer membrane beta-barrel protein [Enterobacteriaceae bacterium H11S18]|uniref:Ail/Lom family outer membrane beta-barrel protein n=1 Tax=Dryocola clanedunensis TaxID=2925396 RepID=UPI0022F0A120|nr:Ail/Lom family outer membrane beta-barrel protein [Dryocola clanedunensis]MCT4706082.1 Ail/Lom family outer membrane beta-barrel protein [Dryocola clanedunensis]MCT4709218.1 Ail/Lom family outer membrane beta-barrel protein [Dryocola clanedunensis]
MKMIATALVLAGSVLAAQTAMAESQTVSVGYAHSKIENATNLDGVNLQYRYEWDSPWGLMGSFTWMQGDDSEAWYDEDDGSKIKDSYDGKYYSLMAGPTYRVADWFSVYGSLGLAYAKIDGDTKWHGTGYRESYSADSTSVAWGVGMMLNPTENISVNVGYEGTSADLYGNRGINGYNVGLGYRF